MRPMSRKAALVLGTLVLGGAAAALLAPWQQAQVRSQRVTEIVAICKSGIDTNRKAMLIQELCDRDDGEARDALEELADSGDGTLAVFALPRRNTESDSQVIRELGGAAGKRTSRLYPRHAASECRQTGRCARSITGGADTLSGRRM